MGKLDSRYDPLDGQTGQFVGSKAPLDMEKNSFLKRAYGIVRDSLDLLKHPGKNARKVRDYNGVVEEKDTLQEDVLSLGRRLGEEGEKKNQLARDLEELTAQNNLLEGQDQKLQERIKELEGAYGICRTQMHRMGIEMRRRHRTKLNYAIGLMVRKANESDSRLSYVIIGGSKKIITATPAFLKKFGFDDKIVGKSYFDMLKSPEEGGEGYSKRVKTFFRDATKRNLETTIVDNEGKERVIRLVKHSPEIVEYDSFNDDGRLVEKKSHYFLTQVDIHDIGGVRKVKGIGKRFYHSKSPETLGEFAAAEQIKEILKEREIHGIDSKIKDSVGMIMKGLTVKEIDFFWNKSKTYERYFNNCWKKIFKDSVNNWYKEGLPKEQIKAIWKNLPKNEIFYETFQGMCMQEARRAESIRKE